MKILGEAQHGPALEPPHRTEHVIAKPVIGLPRKSYDKILCQRQAAGPPIHIGGHGH